MYKSAVDLSSSPIGAPAVADEPGAVMLDDTFCPAPLAPQNEVGRLHRRIADLERQNLDLQAANTRLERRVQNAGQPGSIASNTARDSVRRAMTVRSAFDLRAHLAHVRQWSEKTFGPGQRAEPLINDIIKELLEIEERPGDLMAWVDVVILGFDGAWRCGRTPAEIVSALVLKQLINESRAWPDWRSLTRGQAVRRPAKDLDHQALPGSAGTVN